MKTRLNKQGRISVRSHAILFCEFCDSSWPFSQRTLIQLATKIHKAHKRTNEDPATDGNLATEPSKIVTLALASFAVALVCLGQYVALDYFIVRLRPYPAEANDYDRTLLLFPILPTLWDLRQSVCRITYVGCFGCSNLRCDLCDRRENALLELG